MKDINRADASVQKAVCLLLILVLTCLYVASCGVFWDSVGVKATIHELYIPHVVSVEYPERITVGEELKIVIHSSVSAAPGLVSNSSIETSVLGKPTYAVETVDYDRFIGLILRERPPGMSDNLGYQNPYTCSLGTQSQAGVLRIMYGTPIRPEDGGRSVVFKNTSARYPPPSDWIEYKEFTIEVVAAE